MKRPNIVFILADDLGWCDLGVTGSPYYESPHIDRIAHEGMRFTQGYAACQVCSPSRASILTGKTTPRHGITNFLKPPTGEAWRTIGRCDRLLPPDHEAALRHDETTFAGVLRRNGYRTFFAGKWHLGTEGSLPEDHGFEVNKGGDGTGTPRGGYFSPYQNGKLEDGEPGESLPLRLADETVRFIHRHKDEPFLAYLSFYSVHCPIQTTQPLWKKYRDKADQAGSPDHRFVFDRRLPVRQVQDCPVYGGMIESMDQAVGRVLETLDRLGLTDQTIVCFTSDNGGVSSGDAYSSSMLPLRGGKGRQWEGGIREPFLVRFPGLVRPESVCDVPVSGIDFYPTFMDLTGLSAPPEQVMDGRSMVNLLGGDHDSGMAERDLFWHYPHYGNQGGEPSAIIRNGTWKLIHYYEGGRDELYHLENDPGETRDVADERRDEARRLRRRLDTWLNEVHANLPEPDPEYDPEKKAKLLHEAEHELMPQLEEEHAAYLRPDWQPNEDWWGSQITAD